MTLLKALKKLKLKILFNKIDHEAFFTGKNRSRSQLQVDVNCFFMGVPANLLMFYIIRVISLFKIKIYINFLIVIKSFDKDVQF